MYTVLDFVKDYKVALLILLTFITGFAIALTRDAPSKPPATTPRVFVLSIDETPHPLGDWLAIHYALDGVPHFVYAPDMDTANAFLEWLHDFAAGGGE